MTLVRRPHGSASSKLSVQQSFVYNLENVCKASELTWFFCLFLQMMLSTNTADGVCLYI